MSSNQTQASEPSADVFDLLQTAVIVVDAELTVQRVNAAAQSLLQTSQAKIVGVELPKVLPAADELLGATRRALLEGRSFSERSLDLHLHNRATMVDCSVTPLWQGGAEPARALIELTSVELQQHVQLEGNLLLQNNASSAVLQGLAHEIKNPLGGIRGAAQLLELELDNQRLAEYTQVIIDEADRLRNLVDRMLGPRSACHREMVNIHDLLEHVRMVVDAERGGNAAIRRDYDPSLPPVYVDRDQVIQALMNVVRNAIQAINGSDSTVTLRTRIQRKVTIASTLHRQVVQVEVIDTGPGVDPDLRHSIFLPLVSGHASGSGLGLPIAQSLIHRQGGLIGFDSEPGLTTFSVWLPLGGTDG